MVLGHTYPMSSGRLSAYSRAHRRRILAATSVPVLLSCLLAGCGGGDNKVAAAAQNAPSSGTTATANAFTLTGEWPLTGEKLDGSPPDHPVYVVKIDNTSYSQPQIGLSSADMVVEELVEGGLTRLAAFFYSDIPSDVGPVRSMRASDVGIVKPASADLVASGGAKRTIRIIANHHIPTKTEGTTPTGFYRDDARTAPYNLFMKLSELAAKPGDKVVTTPAAPYLPFGSADDFQGTTSNVKAIAATFSGSHTTNWAYTDAGWVRQDSPAQTGDDFVADNVLLLRVRIGNAGYLDPAGNPVPETEFFGKGQAILVHGESALTCMWHKKDKGSPITLATKDGTAVTVPAGHTWIELVPSQTGSVTLGK
jgi:Protein of unknown function (DUF3048) N-terminal domain/Protein of unknown function (DUF3048) C-terminal domain